MCVCVTVTASQYLTATNVSDLSFFVCLWTFRQSHILSNSLPDTELSAIIYSPHVFSLSFFCGAKTIFKNLTVNLFFKQCQFMAVVLKKTTVIKAFLFL